MPATSIFASDLFSLLGRTLDEKELESAMLGCKARVESIEGEEIRLEVLDSNRVDLLSAEGIARTLKGYLGIETGLPKFRTRPSGGRVYVDPKVKKVRPCVVACCAWGVTLSDQAIVSYMNLQEKMHTTYGRGRRRMAIGFYDLDLIKPPVTYTVTRPDEHAFVPLGSEEEMTPRRILAEHPKGREFAHLLEGFDRYPILLDSENQVLSMPPIINSNTLGRVTPQTRNLFVEATGMDFRALSLGLNVLATALADRGGRIGSVELVYGKRDVRITPELSTETRTLDPERCNRLLGLNMSRNQMIVLLRKARFGARPHGALIEVEVPPYRGDIMHEADLIEEVAVMYGYHRMTPIRPEIPTVGRTDELEDFSDAVRELMIGLGFQEIMTFILTSPDNVCARMGNRSVPFVEIENPVSQNFSIFRPNLLPSVMEFLSHNAHVSYPQLVFEVGDAVELAGQECRTARKLSFAWADSKVNFTQIKGVAESILLSLGASCEMRPTTDPAFIDGRAASMILGQQAIGVLGEIHPAVLAAWQLPVPVLAAEMDIGLLMKAVTKR